MGSKGAGDSLALATAIATCDPPLHRPIHVLTVQSVIQTALGTESGIENVSLGLLRVDQGELVLVSAAFDGVSLSSFSLIQVYATALATTMRNGVRCQSILEKSGDEETTLGAMRHDGLVMINRANISQRHGPAHAPTLGMVNAYLAQRREGWNILHPFGHRLHAAQLCHPMD